MFVFVGARCTIYRCFESFVFRGCCGIDFNLSDLHFNDCLGCFFAAQYDESDAQQSQHTGDTIHQDTPREFPKVKETDIPTTKTHAYKSFC